MTADIPTGSAARGIATIADDKVYDWVVPFLESWARTNAATPLYLIPYDDDCDRTRRACEIYGVAVDLAAAGAAKVAAHDAMPVRRTGTR